MLQDIIDTVDAQIQKERSPIVNVLIGIPLFLIISLPIAMVAAVVVLMVVGTTGQVGQDGATAGVIAGVLTILIFTAWASYGVYSNSNGDDDPSSGELREDPAT